MEGPGVTELDAVLAAITDSTLADLAARAAALRAEADRLDWLRGRCLEARRGDPPAAGKEPEKPDPRLAVARFLAANDPQTEGMIRHSLGLKKHETRDLLGHPWFELEAGAWRLTQDGREAAKGETTHVNGRRK